MELDETDTWVTFWIQNIPNVATNDINIWFLTHNALCDQGKLNLIVLLIA